uniref:Ribosomal RNA-processing protein 8 n=1 Tax=Rhabditophanes sp. KR3021 TaxID=114890 RepID=A0AC35TXS1_9BILA
MTDNRLFLPETKLLGQVLNIVVTIENSELSVRVYNLETNVFYFKRVTFKMGETAEAIEKGVTTCAMANVPLENAAVDVFEYCLSVMRTIILVSGA